MNNRVYVMVGGSTSLVFQLLFLGPLISLTSGKKMSFLLHQPNKGIDYINELFDAGNVVPVIDRSYPLEEVPMALRYLEDRHARGKVVITI